MMLLSFIVRKIYTIAFLDRYSAGYSHISINLILELSLFWTYNRDFGGLCVIILIKTQFLGYLMLIRHKTNRCYLVLDPKTAFLNR